MAAAGFVIAPDGVRIAFEDSGTEGPLVLLLHGGMVTPTSNFRTCFQYGGDGRIGPAEGPNLESVLLGAGARVVFIHTRGHGLSDKPHDPARYRGDVHLHDVKAVLNVLDVESVDVVGYSMGSCTAMRLLSREPRIRSAVLAGTGPHLVEGRTPGSGPLGQCFVNNQWDEHPEFKPARAQARSDPNHDFAAIGAALIGLEGAPRQRLTDASIPVLVVNGAQDDGDKDAATLAAMIPDATGIVIGESNHALAPSDPAIQQAILTFLRSQWPRPQLGPGQV